MVRTSFFFLSACTEVGGQAIGRAGADRPHESGGGGSTDGLRPERIRHEVEPASIGADLLDHRATSLYAADPAGS